MSDERSRAGRTGSGDHSSSTSREKHRRERDTEKMRRLSLGIPVSLRLESRTFASLRGDESLLHRLHQLRHQVEMFKELSPIDHRILPSRITSHMKSRLDGLNDLRDDFEGFTVILARLNDIVVGWALLEPPRKDRENKCFFSVFVDEKYRQRGIGSQLVSAVKAQCIKNFGARQLYGWIPKSGPMSDAALPSMSDTEA